jgi:hypothetical protein
MKKIIKKRVTRMVLMFAIIAIPTYITLEIGKETDIGHPVLTYILSTAIVAAAVLIISKILKGLKILAMWILQQIVTFGYFLCRKYNPEPDLAPRDE